MTSKVQPSFEVGWLRFSPSRQFDVSLLSLSIEVGSFWLVIRRSIDKVRVSRRVIRGGNISQCPDLVKDSRIRT
jgi:hypothetical protein